MEATAKVRHLRVTPMKARRVVDLVRGKRATEAVQVLRFSPQTAAEAVLDGIHRRRARVLIGSDAKGLDVLARLLPASYPTAVQGLERLLAQEHDALAADVFVIADSVNWDVGTPAFTTSLRGLAGGNFSVKVLSEGVHSGDASGVVPSSFRVLRDLLSRLEDEATGKIKIEGLYSEIPEERLAQARKVAAVAHDGLARAVTPVHSMSDGDTVFCLASGRRPLSANVELGAAGSVAALNALLEAAADVFMAACLDALLSAEGRGPWRSYTDLAPSTAGGEIPGAR